jgi:hypothetical protein
MARGTWAVPHGVFKLATVLYLEYHPSYTSPILTVTITVHMQSTRGPRVLHHGPRLSQSVSCVASSRQSECSRGNRMSMLEPIVTGGHEQAHRKAMEVADQLRYHFAFKSLSSNMLAKLMLLRWWSDAALASRSPPRLRPSRTPVPTGAIHHAPTHPISVPHSGWEQIIFRSIFVVGAKPEIHRSILD